MSGELPSSVVLSEAFNFTKADIDHRVIPYFQPIVTLTSGGRLEVTGFETVARMLPEKIGDSDLTPDKFLPHIQGELSSRLDFRMLDHACRVVKKSMDSGLRLEDIPHFSVNFSPDTLADKGAAEKIAACLEKYGVPADKIGIEVLESSFGSVENKTYIFDTLRDVSLAENSILVDDLGAGAADVDRVETLLETLGDTAKLTVKIDIALVQEMQSKQDYSFIWSECFKKAGTVVLEGPSVRAMCEIMKMQSDYMGPEKLPVIKFQTYEISPPRPEADLFANFMPEGKPANRQIQSMLRFGKA